MAVSPVTAVVVVVVVTVALGAALSDGAHAVIVHITTDTTATTPAANRTFFFIVLVPPAKISEENKRGSCQPIFLLSIVWQERLLISYLSCCYNGMPGNSISSSGLGTTGSLNVAKLSAVAKYRSSNSGDSYACLFFIVTIPFPYAAAYAIAASP